MGTWVIGQDKSNNNRTELINNEHKEIAMLAGMPSRSMVTARHTLQICVDDSLPEEYNPRQKRQEIVQMSCVYAMFSKNGIVMCSDSKNSIRKEGKYELSKDHPSVKKVFKTDHMIIATWGTNMILNQGEMVSMESAVKTILGVCRNEVDFIYYIDGIIQAQKKETEYDYSYSFLIGSKDAYDGNYVMNEYVIDRTRTALVNTYRDYGIIAGGFYKFIPNESDLKVSADDDLERMKNTCKSLVQYTIDQEELLKKYGILDYFPVGGEIQMESFV